MGVILGSYLHQAIREGLHLKRQKEGRAMIAHRLGIPGPWQPEMVNYPSFVCGNCQFPHVILQTLVGCKACAAPYFPSEVLMAAKNGQLTCVACDAVQDVGKMPFCCCHCRCLQGSPLQPDWRRNYVQAPAWRSLIGYVITGVIGLVIILVCMLRGQGDLSRSAADGLQMLGFFFGGIPLLIAVIGLIVLLMRRKFPSELYLSCGGIGYRTETGEERWYSWAQVTGLEARQQFLDTSTLNAHPDSTATSWVVHTAQERLFFDNRLEGARDFAHQVRARAPFAQLVDTAPLKRTNPWVVLIIILAIVLVFVGIAIMASR